MRVVTFNVNGIRAAQRRGFSSWLAASNADVVCLQEVRCPVALIPNDLFDGYQMSYHQGDQPGRNGVAILTRDTPQAVRIGFGDATFDAQGRYIEVDLPGLTLASLYLPKGATEGEKYDNKMRFMSLLAAHTAARAAGTREYLVCGDFNIAPAQADIKAWKANLKSEGFLPEERAWIASLADCGLTDVVRALHPQEAGPYSWWSWRGKAFDNDAGWRIDHHYATSALASAASAAWVDRAPSYAERISDHAPVLVDYELSAR